MEFKKINKITIDAEMTNGLNGTFELDLRARITSQPSKHVWIL